MKLSRITLAVIAVLGAGLGAGITSSAFALEARWIFPLSAPPIADGCITIEGGRIVAVGPPAPR